MRAATASESSPKRSAPRADKSARSNTLDNIVAEVKNSLGDEWPPQIYSELILSLRTRSHLVPPASKNASVEVQHTLLGIELKVGRRRVSCPDLATARYLSVFARVGVSEIAVPYDITKISHLADVLESAWQRMLLLADHLTEGRVETFRSRVRSSVMREAKREIEVAGVGTAIPQFKQDTRQRPQRI